MLTHFQVLGLTTTTLYYALVFFLDDIFNLYDLIITSVTKST